jgi:hypothetical protein
VVEDPAVTDRRYRPCGFKILFANFPSKPRHTFDPLVVDKCPARQHHFTRFWKIVGREGRATEFGQVYINIK